MRKFGLITGNGKIIDLTSRKIFLHDPDGLGFEIEESYRKVGQQWFLLSSAMRQQSITGTVAFIGDDPYAQYNEFIYDITKDGLILTYTTDDGLKTYKRKVKVTNIGKTEYTTAGYLDCPITFTSYTPWYLELSISTVMSESVGNYGWVWDTNLTWPYKFRSTIDMTVVANLDTYMESPCALIIDGPLTNPVWRHFVNGELYATGKVNCTVDSDEHLVIDNRNDPYKIVKYNSDFTTILQDAYQLSDFSMDRFIKLQNGQNLIQVSTESANVVNIKLEANRYYESV